MSTRLSARLEWRTPKACAVMPPSDRPTMWACSTPSASRRPARSSAKSSIVTGRSTTGEWPCAGGKLEANDVHGKPERVSAELPGGGAIALATLEPNSGGHRLQFRPELTSHQHRREVADPVPEPLGEAAGNDRPIRECDVAHRLCAESQEPEPDGRVDHARGFRGRGWINRVSGEPELLQAGEALLVGRGSCRRGLCGSRLDGSRWWRWCRTLVAGARRRERRCTRDQRDQH